MTKASTADNSKAANTESTDSIISKIKKITKEKSLFLNKEINNVPILEKLREMGCIIEIEHLRRGFRKIGKETRFNTRTTDLEKFIYLNTVIENIPGTEKHKYELHPMGGKTCMKIIMPPASSEENYKVYTGKAECSNVDFYCKRIGVFICLLRVISKMPEEFQNKFQEFLTY